MGIRFQCRNGHKLHVKSFLAGKRGICPKCSVKLVIPNDSIGNKTSTRDSAIQVVTTGPVESVWNAEIVPTERQEVQNGPPGPRALPPAALPSETRSDPIGEAQHSVWYVRPPTGEQYGPASGEVLRMWIAEGRVTSNCHVWCEGWDDWRSAGVLLRAEQVRTVEPPANVEPVVATPPTAVEMLRINTVGRPKAGTKQRKRTLMWVCLLLIVCFVLLVPLYLVTIGS